MRNGSIGDGAQADENLRKNSRLNYELAALPGELRRRIWPRKIAGKCIFRESLSTRRLDVNCLDHNLPNTRNRGDRRRIHDARGSSILLRIRI